MRRVRRGGERAYLVKSGGRAAWRMLAACDAVGSMGLEDGLYVLPVASPAARSRFACGWAARGFRWNGAEGRFEAEGLPRAPERRIPQDFLDYLAGRREDHAAPFLLTAPGAGAD